MLQALSNALRDTSRAQMKDINGRLMQENEKKILNVRRENERVEFKPRQ